MSAGAPKTHSSARRGQELGLEQDPQQQPPAAAGESGPPPARKLRTRRTASAASSAASLPAAEPAEAQAQVQQPEAAAAQTDFDISGEEADKVFENTGEPRGADDEVIVDDGLTADERALLKEFSFPEDPADMDKFVTRWYNDSYDFIGDAIDSIRASLKKLENALSQPMHEMETAATTNVAARLSALGVCRQFHQESIAGLEHFFGNVVTGAEQVKKTVEQSQTQLVQRDRALPAAED